MLDTLSFTVLIVGLLFLAVAFAAHIFADKIPAWSVLIFVFCMVLFAVVKFTSASAAENSALPAPAESAIAVKGYTSCPTEWNPDDPSWAMHEEKRENKQIKDTVITVTERKRTFSYFPDPEQRIWVGLKKWENPDCVAEMFSYGSASGVNQKRIWAAIRRPTDKEIPIFLLTEKGWESGNRLIISFDDSANKLIFALYRNEVVVASRELPVESMKRYYHFWQQEPVE